MNARIVRSAAISFGLAGLLAAAPAAAVESLTGTWEGSLKCQTLDSGNTTKSKVDQTVTIIDNGAEGVTLQLVSTKGTFNGFIVADGRKAENGILSAVSCDLDDSDFEGAVLQVDLKTKTGDEKASMKGDLILMHRTDEIAESCQLSAKRVSSAEPKVFSCPPE